MDGRGPRLALTRVERSEAPEGGAGRHGGGKMAAALTIKLVTSDEYLCYMYEYMYYILVSGITGTCTIIRYNRTGI